ncbi:MAG: DUF1592 domain-containing protein [Sandaracinaceae bacterium]
MRSTGASGAPAALALLLALGCVGQVESAGPSRPGGPSVRTGRFVPSPAPLRRLTRAQIENSVHTVFGPEITVRLPEDLDAPPETFASIEATRATVGRRSAERYEEAALDVAAQVLAAAERYPALSGCAPRPTSACARDALTAFGRPLFRRDLEAAELDRLGAIVEAGGTDPEARRLGLQYALAALLVSPSFLYLHHAGEALPNGARRFTGEELAARLAAFLWDGLPDAELLAAAARGDLDEPAGVEAQARRMLADARAEGLATRFFGEAWRVVHLDGGAKSPDVFPAWSAEVADLYRTELDETLRHLVMADDADLRELLVGRTTWVNSALGELYGISVDGEGWRPVALPAERHGLLTSGAVMAANANPDRTSPTHRGLFVLSQFLCGSTPDPPEGVDLSILDRTGLTGREVVEMHLSDGLCAGCHAAFDPLGLAFERFDAMGAYRTAELGQPIDVAVEIEGRALDGSADLAAFLAGDPRVPRCLARNLYGFALGTAAGEDQVPLTDALGGHLVESGWSFAELVVALATSEGFRTYRPDGDEG